MRSADRAIPSKGKLGSCSEHLSKAVVYMAASPGTPQEKLRGMVANNGFGSLAEDDFPRGPLRGHFQSITGQMRDDTGPQSVTRIAVMCDERARSVIEQIYTLADDVFTCSARAFRSPSARFGWLHKPNAPQK
jgi:hypothetical protein